MNIQAILLNKGHQYVWEFYMPVKDTLSGFLLIYLNTKYKGLHLMDSLIGFNAVTISEP